MSWFSDVELGPSVEAFALMKAFNEDTFEKKVYLSAGVYRTAEGKPWVLPVVRHVDRKLADSLNKEYLPILGLESFSIAATNLLLGLDSPAIIHKKAFGIQCLSGTGSLTVGAEFLARVLKRKIFYHSKPTWENHILLFKNAGFTEGREYRYWNPSTRGLDFDGLIEDLKNAPRDSVVILHACAHNPTGTDPTPKQWDQIADVMKERKLFPFFDCAYQGFASGNVSKDAFAVRRFASLGFEFFCAQSFAKNFGLYNERVGNLTVVVKNPELIPTMKSQFTIVIRGMYSNPPAHGARIVESILTNPELFAQWEDNIKTMSSRIIDMRKQLREALEQLNTPGDWSHITQHIGMFTYTGLNEIQCKHLLQKHHVYLLRSGRISMTGLNPSNVHYVAKAIHETLSSMPSKI